MIIEFSEQNFPVYDEIMNVLKKYPAFEYSYLEDKSALSISGLEIYPSRRKIYHNQSEINLTTKEFEILILLVANKGCVLTYNQIYQDIWGEDGLGSENNMVGCHVRHLRGKLYQAEPNASFKIRCIREVGYCFETE